MNLHAAQMAFAAHLRDPEGAPAPPGIEPRRLKIYQDLVFNNIDNFCRTGFPVLFSLIDAADWQCLIRAFIVRHRAHTPYFLEISQEFLAFLEDKRADFDFLPPFTDELARYEWVELALDVADQDLASLVVVPDGDLVAGRPLVNPLAWVLACRYPVHQISATFQPAEPLPSPVFLVVYRNRAEDVKFLEINAVTARLLEILNAGDAPGTGNEALRQLAGEMPQVNAATAIDAGRQALARLRSLDILLGCHCGDGTM